jgi:hypothetical protein
MRQQGVTLAQIARLSVRVRWRCRRLVAGEPLADPGRAGARPARDVPNGRVARRYAGARDRRAGSNRPAPVRRGQTEVGHGLLARARIAGSCRCALRGALRRRARYARRPGGGLRRRPRGRKHPVPVRTTVAGGHEICYGQTGGVTENQPTSRARRTASRWRRDRRPTHRRRHGLTLVYLWVLASCLPYSASLDPRPSPWELAIHTSRRCSCVHASVLKYHSAWRCAWLGSALLSGIFTTFSV